MALEKRERYRAYPEYKDSGVAWLGEIPKEWNLIPLKRVIEDCTNGFWGSEADGINDIVVLRVADFNREQLTISDDKLTYRSIEPQDRERRLLKPDDILIEKSGGGEKTLVGCVVYFDKDYLALTSNFVAKMTPKPNYSGRYLCYAFHTLYSGRVNFASIKQTTGIQNLDSDAYLLEKFSFPNNKDEQLRIAGFLDHETAKIDDLIQKQQRLIELLREKRQAVISHAVTKGLDPNAPMKDSGIEWLGEIPEHWKVIKLSYLLLLQSGSGITSENIEETGTYPVFGGNGIRGYTETYNCEGDYALIGRQGALCGNINIAKGKFFASEHAVVAYPHKKFNLTYLEEFLRFMNLGQYSVSAAQPGISVDRVNQLPFIYPIIEDQNKIGTYIDNQVEKIETLTQKANDQIKLLKERRTALISAAVTGKIDLRDWEDGA